MALLLSAVGCDSPAPDGTVGPTDRSQLDRPLAGESSVLQFSEPWLPECADGCENAYLELSTRFTSSKAFLTSEELQGRLAEATSMPPPVRLGLDPSTLREQIVDALGIRLLLEGIERRRLAVAVLRDLKEAEFTRRKLLFWDPVVGSFEGTLLLPNGGSNGAAVVGLHGHRDDDLNFTRDSLGQELAASGFAVLVPRLRAHDCSRMENRLARELLRHGLTLIGLHVYESLLMLKYLRQLDGVAKERIGILGHSGGSSIASLAARVSDGFAAQVIDYQIHFRNRCGPEDVHCETVPSLMPLALDIHDRRTLSAPSRRMWYGYSDPDVRAQVPDFFRKHLVEGNRESQETQ